jgi:putative ATP-binding cassette transporter
MRVIKWLLTVSIFDFVFAGVASVVGALLTIAIMVLVFRLVGEDKEARLLLFVVLCTGAVGSQALARTLIRSAGRTTSFLLQVELFRRILAAPLADLERIGQSNLTLALMDDVGRIAAIVPNLVVLCANVTLFLAFIAYLGWLSPAKLVLSLIVIAIGAACHFLLRREGARQTRISRQKRNDVLDAFRAAYAASKELKLHSARREQAITDLEARARELQRSVERQSSFFGGSIALAQALFYITLGLVMFGPGGGSTDRHIVVSFGIGIIYLMRPLQTSIQIAQELAAANIALDRVEELGFALDEARALNVRAPDLGATAPSVVMDKFERLEFVGVTYLYRIEADESSTEFSLGPIDLTLSKGEIVFVIGANGSGKTTLAKLLTGLYWPTSGSIHLNGQVLRPTDVGGYSQLFTALFSDFFTFDRFLEGKECTDDLLRRFKLDRGRQLERNEIPNPSELSLGERKRLALLFAYLDDKPIVILDESGADQDPYFKDVFYNEILRDFRSRGKLVVVISHDDRYFGVADKIVRLDRGQVLALDAVPTSSFHEVQIF